ncbi:MAG: SulP family inorganic anion transporter, partial [Betaproteobacteria bacterium]|nr:SulP family inorganic anion transporter [Betaproteobacteria bacterium]
KWLALPKGMTWFEGLQHPDVWQKPSLLIGAATATVMVLAPRLSTRIPPVIQGLVAGILTYWGLALTAYPDMQSLARNAFVIGPLAADLSGLGHAITGPWMTLGEMALPHWEQIVVPALTLAVLLSIDTLKTCVVLDAMSGTRHNSNKELIGQGLGNTGCRHHGGHPGQQGQRWRNRHVRGISGAVGVFGRAAVDPLDCLDSSGGSGGLAGCHWRQDDRLALF